MTATARIRRYLALDDPWERPTAAIGRSDVLVAVGLAVLASLSLELVRAGGVLREVGQPVWLQQLATVSAPLLLIARRRLPLTVATLAAVHLFVVGVVMPLVMGQFMLQVVYATAIYSGVAWARNRTTTVLVVGSIVVFMFAWIALSFAVGRSLEEQFTVPAAEQDPAALLGPLTSGVLLTLLINALFFGGAVGFGQAAWWRARERTRLAEQARTISEQADRLRDQAVVSERLRIARDLHDVVAHHVSVVGIHAAAGRRVMDKDPVAARESLHQVEESTREAVEQMRQLLGALRQTPAEAEAASPDVGSAPRLADVAELVRAWEDSRLEVALTLVEDPPGAGDRVPPGHGLAVYRIAQEALTNVARHSTARHAQVALRVSNEETGRGTVEVEITDDGRPRAAGQSVSSGLGQLGIRERARSLHGTVDIGPRPVGGYRVRVRLPLGGVG
ncbi:sensor histidine kinase [Nocardioidaceae bacterium]|nr:sensor histidine kinase [Nocardioidaceae bacterium]